MPANLPLPPRARFSAATPSSPEGLEAWRRALRSNRRNAEAELPDVPRLIAVWFAERPGVPIPVDELVRLALREGLLPHTLRKTSQFRIRCVRLAELLGRVALAQGKQGIPVPGGLRLRIAKVSLDRAHRDWIVRTAEDADRALEVARREAEEAERKRDAKVLEKRRTEPGRRHIVRRPTVRR